MVQIGMDASEPYTIGTRTTPDGDSVVLEKYVENPFIPEDYLPTIRDVRFFGAFGIMAVFAYGVSFLGSLALTAFAIYAIDTGNGASRNDRYYGSRLVFYSFIVVIAGLSQVLVGSYTLYEFGSGPLLPPVSVAMYQIHFPEISMAVGCLQMVIGYYGILRYLGWVKRGPEDHQFQILIAFQWASMLGLQNLVQIGYAEGDEGAGAAPSVALLSVGMNILPAFLDFKMREHAGYTLDSRSLQLAGESLPKGEETMDIQPLIPKSDINTSENDAYDQDPIASEMALRKVPTQERALEVEERSGDMGDSSNLRPLDQRVNSSSANAEAPADEDAARIEGESALVDNELELALQGQPTQQKHKADSSHSSEEGSSSHPSILSNDPPPVLEGDTSTSAPADQPVDNAPPEKAQNNAPMHGFEPSEGPHDEILSEGPNDEILSGPLPDLDSSDDDSTAVLQAKLDEIEKEIYTLPIDKYAQSLSEIL